MKRYVVTWTNEYDAENTEDAFLQAIADLDDVINRKIGASYFKIQSVDGRVTKYIDYEQFVEDDDAES